MNQTPDSYDPDWARYPETILLFPGEPPFEIDLRAQISPQSIASLKAIGLHGTFGVMTAFDPRGENLSQEENERRAEDLNRRLEEAGVTYVRVDACSPDRSHCECSVAVKMSRVEVSQLATEMEQVASFWFDGACFWIDGALARTDPLSLPRSS